MGRWPPRQLDKQRQGWRKSHDILISSPSHACRADQIIGVYRDRQVYLDPRA